MELNIKKKYIAKKHTWFDEGAEVALLTDYRPFWDMGLFKGPRNGKLNEENCSFDEFQEVNDV